MTREQLSTLRRRVGTQSEVAELLGVATRTISAAEREEDYPRRRLYGLAIRGLILEQMGADAARSDGPQN